MPEIEKLLHAANDLLSCSYAEMHSETLGGWGLTTHSAGRTAF
jgi:hypothetical protein